jgi:hypothetical protein
MAFRQYTEDDVFSFRNLCEALLQILINLREKNTPNSDGKSNKIAKFQKL